MLPSSGKIQIKLTHAKQRLVVVAAVVVVSNSIKKVKLILFVATN